MEADLRDKQSDAQGINDRGSTLGAPLDTEFLLCIDSNNWRQDQFVKIPADTLAGILSQDLPEKDSRPAEISDILAAIIEQLREQPTECKTAILMNSDGDFLLKTNPAVGGRDSVSMVFADPPESRKVLVIHNHPVQEDQESQRVSTYGFFSAYDLTFAFKNDGHPAEAVVFQEGTAIIVKTEESQRVISEALRKIGSERWAYTDLSNRLINDYRQQAPNGFEERKAFSIRFAQKYAMRLLFIPADSKNIEVLV